MMGWGGQPACMNVGRDETGELAAAYSSRAEQVIGMALFGLFRRKSPIREPKELAHFIDEQASSFLHESSEASRWQVYPLGLAMMGEVVDAMLRPHAGTQKRALADEMIDLVLGVFDRHPVPAAIGQHAWGDARSELAQRLDQISTQPPKSASDIPAQYVKRYVKAMSVQDGKGPADEGATLEALKTDLVKAQQDLEGRVDAPAMAKALLATGQG